MVSIRNLGIFMLGEHRTLDATASYFKIVRRKTKEGKSLGTYAMFKKAKMSLPEKVQAIFNSDLNYDRYDFDESDAMPVENGWLACFNYSTGSQIPLNFSKDMYTKIDNWVSKEKSKLDALKAGDSAVDQISKSLEDSQNMALTLGLAASVILLVGLLVVAYSIMSSAGQLATLFHNQNANLTAFTKVANAIATRLGAT